MKKTLIFAAFAAALLLAGCNKEKEMAVNTGTSPEFTASINPSTPKTTVNVSNGKVSWEETDEITVKDAAQNTAVYKISSINKGNGEAYFVKKEGADLGAGPYTATYGTDPATAQTYSETVCELPMSAQADGTVFIFKVQCGLMKLNLTKSGESVKSIAVTGTPTGGEETTYTLNCTEAQSIAAAKDFCIVLPAGSYSKIVITDSEDKVCTLTANSSVVIEANQIQPVTFGAEKLNFKAPSEPFARMELKPSLGKEYITKIVIETDVKELPTEEDESCALKMNEKGTIWQVLEDETLYIRTSATEEILLPQDASCLFAYYDTVEEISRLDKLNTYEVCNMNDMFNGCGSLSSLDLSNFNTTQVKSMINMFLGCHSLTEINLSSFITETVSDMSYMFGECNNIDVLDLSSFNTTNTMIMECMFSGCCKLATLMLSSTFVIPDMHENIFQVTGFDTDDQKCHVSGEIHDYTREVISLYENMTIDEAGE